MITIDPRRANRCDGRFYSLANCVLAAVGHICWSKPVIVKEPRKPAKKLEVLSVRFTRAE